jgi:hypothetical protein
MKHIEDVAKDDNGSTNALILWFMNVGHKKPSLLHIYGR